MLFVEIIVQCATDLDLKIGDDYIRVDFGHWLSIFRQLEKLWKWCQPDLHLIKLSLSKSEKRCVIAFRNEIFLSADFLVRLPDRAVVRLVQLRPDVPQRRTAPSPSLCHLRANCLLRCHQVNTTRKTYFYCQSFKPCFNAFKVTWLMID